jgi:Bax protein
MSKGEPLSQDDKLKLTELAKKYRVKPEKLDTQASQEALLARVDIIPASLTLAQAANESAWGKSRFAREANNLFGIWTYDADKGLKPKKRDAGKKHYVRKFADVGESVRYYMHMLNSHPAYAELRKIRRQLRSENETLAGHQLAHGLTKYSAKGDEYIDLIQQLISQNQWAKLDRPRTKA